MNPGDSVLYRTKGGNLIPVRVLASRIAKTGRRCLCVMWPAGDQSWILAEWCIPARGARGAGGAAPQAEPGGCLAPRMRSAMELRARMRSSPNKQGGS